MSLVKIGGRREATVNKGLSWGSRSTPDLRMVDALMTLGWRYDDWFPSDKKREDRNLPDTLREGALTRESHRFFPPEHVEKRDEITNDAKRYWQVLAELILRTAQDRLHKDEAAMEALRTLGGRKVKMYRGYSVRADQAHTYFDIDTSSGYGEYPDSESIARKVKEVVYAVKDALREKVIEVLKEARRMQEFANTAEVSTEIYRKVQLVDEATRIDYIRETVERPEEKELFLELMKQAIEHLSLEDVEVEVDLLESMDAVFLGCKGLYASPVSGTDAAGQRWDRPHRVFVTMTEYGTQRLRELDEVWQTLAHEVAHLQHRVMDKQLYEEGRRQEGVDHDQVHNILTHRNLQILRSLQIDFEVDRSGEVKVSLNPNYTQRPDVVQASQGEASAAGAVDVASLMRLVHRAERAAGQASKSKDAAAQSALLAAQAAVNAQGSGGNVAAQGARPASLTTEQESIMEKLARAMGFRD